MEMKGGIVQDEEVKVEGWHVVVGWFILGWNLHRMGYNMLDEYLIN